MDNIEYILTMNNKPLEIEMFDGIISVIYNPITPKRTESKEMINYTSDKDCFQVYKKEKDLILTGNIPYLVEKKLGEYNIKLNLRGKHHVK